MKKDPLPNSEWMKKFNALEQSLKESKAQEAILQQAQQIAGLGIWEYDIKKDLVKWSLEVYKIYELDSNQDPPKVDDIIDYATPEEKAFIEQTIYNGIKNGEVYNIDGRIITNKGNVKYVNAIGQPYYNQQGELTHLLGTITDITNRKTTEKALQFSDFTIESLPDGIFWVDKQARFVRVNEAACKNLGYTIEELQGMTAKDINPSFDIKKSQEYWEDTKRVGHLVFRTTHTRKDGSVFPVEITNNIFEFDGNEFRCSIVRDITDRVRKEQEIQHALKEVRVLKDRLAEENVYLQEEIKLNHNFDEIISQSAAYKKVLNQVQQVANTEATVLVTGESGTGKELLARAIHNLSNRRNRPLVKVNCATLPANLIESELFGHERGAFTGAIGKKTGRFELANKGTIFLDEIGELPLELQAKLLRVLQEGEFERLGNPRTMKLDVRVIAATNRNLDQAMLKGEFREDLYYRLNVFPIFSIPLRDRKEDIPLLVKHFVNKYAGKVGRQITVIPKKVLTTFHDYDWPGNIRELENLVERAIIISTGNKLTIGDWLPKNRTKKSTGILKTLEEVEREHILKALKHTDGRVSGEKGAARILGMNAKTLDSRIRKLGIKRHRIFDI